MLTQAEADGLIALDKTFVAPSPMDVSGDCQLVRELVGAGGVEQFFLDVSRSSLALVKLKLQKRGRSTVVLVRLEVNAAPHTNPDRTRVCGTHIHVYRSGYDSKWAVELDPGKFTDTASVHQTYLDFCRFCSIAPVHFQGEIS